MRRRPRFIDRDVTPTGFLTSCLPHRSYWWDNPRMPTATNSDHRWIHGPIPDLLIGCGGLYAIAYVALLLSYDEQVVYGLGYILPLGILFVSLPHYGGTLVRVYESREQIQRYRFFTVYATAALAAWFAVGTWDALLGSLMITLYLSWSPWHYSGQNYGIALMFLGRAGVSIEPRAKTALWWSFVLSFLLVLLHLHGSGPGLFYWGGVGDTELGLLPLGLPSKVVNPVFTLVLVAYVGSLAYAASSLLKVASPRALLPAAAIVATQSLWLAVPYVGMRVSVFTGDVTASGFIRDAILWVGVAHGAQYLWITSYYARSSGDWRGPGRYFTRTFLFSSVAWTVPIIVFGPFALGGATHAQGLTLLLVAVVNLHHFVLDGAIWKLRNSRIASILIRDEAATPAPVGHAQARVWRIGLRGAVAVAVTCGVVQIGAYVGGEVVLPLALERGNAKLAGTILAAGEWVGVGGTQTWVAVAELQLETGDREGAERSLRRAIASSDRAVRAEYLLGRMLFEDGELDEAIVHLRRAVDIEPRFERARRELDRAHQQRAMDQRGAEPGAASH